jgi:tetratricopeptide (TPR) repeat protein
MKFSKDLKLLLFVLIGISVLFVVKFVSSLILNEVVIDYYHERVYEDKLIQGLYIANIVEREVVHYNHGNLLYKQEKYEEAAKKYEKALSYVNENNKHLCPIVNNYVLTLTHLIDAETNEEKAQALRALQEKLYEYNCAGEGESNGSSQSSDELENQIQKAIDELEGQEEQKEQTQEEKQKEKELEEKLDEQEKQSRSSRNEDQQEDGKPTRNESNW